MGFSSRNARALASATLFVTACWPPLDELERVTTDAATDGATGDGGADAEKDANADAAGASAGAAYTAAVMADAPLAYYRLSEPDGNVARDSSGHANDATFDGPIARAPSGVFAQDGAVVLGGGSRIDAGDRFAFGTADSFTIEAWVRPDANLANDASYRRIAERETLNPENGIDVFYRGGADPHLGFARLVGGNTHEGVYAPSGFHVSTTDFTHVVVVSRANEEVRLFVNGALVDAQPISAPAAAATNARFYFGGSVGGTGFVGALDELAVYGAALTDARVQAHFAAAR